MSALPHDVPPDSASGSPLAGQPYPLTVEQVLAMVEHGVLGPADPCELLGGTLTAMPPQGPEHTWLVMHIARLLAETLPDGHVGQEGPIRTSDTSLPEPDVVVTREPRRRDRHPRGDECLLVVEVAVTSLHVDRAKSRIYAEGQVSTYWLLDVVGRRLTAFSGPQEGGTWREQHTFEVGERVPLPDGATHLPVATLLGEDPP